MGNTAVTCHLPEKASYADYNTLGTFLLSEGFASSQQRCTYTLWFSILDYAKAKIRDFVIALSFDNVLKYHEQYIPTSTERDIFHIKFREMSAIKNVDVSIEIIDFFVQPILHSRLNDFCREIGCSLTWRIISDFEKKNSRYSNHDQWIQFGTLHVNKKSRMRLLESQYGKFEPFDKIGETCLFSKFRELGLPPFEAQGWIIRAGRIKLNRVDIVRHVDKQMAANPKWRCRCVSTLPSYQKQYSKYRLRSKYIATCEEHKSILGRRSYISVDDGASVGPPPKKKSRVA